MITIKKSYTFLLKSVFAQSIVQTLYIFVLLHCLAALLAVTIIISNRSFSGTFYAASWQRFNKLLMKNFM